MSTPDCLVGFEAGPAVGITHVVRPLASLNQTRKASLSDSAQLDLMRLRPFTDPALTRLPFETLLHELLSRLEGAMHADTAGVLLAVPGGQSFTVRAAVGTDAQLVKGLSIPVDDGIAGRIASSVQPTTSLHVRMLDPGSPLFGKLRHVAGAPLVVKGQLLGIIYAGKLDRSLHARFSDADTALLQLVGDRIGLALTCARLLEGDTLERARLEEAVRTARSRLRQNGRRAAAERDRLRSALQEITRITEFERQKDDAVAAISHDLKGPLAALKLRAQLLQRQLVSTADWQEVRGRLTQGLVEVQATVGRMAIEMENLMDIAKLQVGQALPHHPQVVDLIDLMHHVVAEEQLVSEADISVESPRGRLEGLWDPSRLNRAFSNLIDNAIKFSPGRARIDISIESQSIGEDRWAVVTVTDAGLGIPQDDLPRIFTRFYRGRNAQAARGTGLGLASVHQIVTAHGGTVSVASQESRGTTATVRLPLAANPQ